MTQVNYSNFTIRINNLIPKWIIKDWHAVNKCWCIKTKNIVKCMQWVIMAIWLKKVKHLVADKK